MSELFEDDDEEDTEFDPDEDACCSPVSLTKPALTGVCGECIRELGFC